MLDITGADALSVIFDHVTKMEHWNAYAELNRDLNTLRTYKRFRFVSDVIDQHGTLTDSSRMLYILIEVFKSWNFNSVST